MQNGLIKSILKMIIENREKNREKNNNNNFRYRASALNDDGRLALPSNWLKYAYEHPDTQI